MDASKTTAAPVSATPPAAPKRRLVIRDVEPEAKAAKAKAVKVKLPPAIAAAEVKPVVPSKAPTALAPVMVSTLRAAVAVAEAFTDVLMIENRPEGLSLWFWFQDSRQGFGIQAFEAKEGPRAPWYACVELRELRKGLVGKRGSDVVVLSPGLTADGRIALALSEGPGRKVPTKFQSDGVVAADKRFPFDVSGGKVSPTLSPVPSLDVEFPFAFCGMAASVDPARSALGNLGVDGLRLIGCDGHRLNRATMHETLASALVGGNLPAPTADAVVNAVNALGLGVEDPVGVGRFDGNVRFALAGKFTTVLIQAALSKEAFPDYQRVLPKAKGRNTVGARASDFSRALSKVVEADRAARAGEVEAARENLRKAKASGIALEVSAAQGRISTLQAESVELELEQAKGSPSFGLVIRGRTHTERIETDLAAKAVVKWHQAFDPTYLADAVDFDGAGVRFTFGGGEHQPIEVETDGRLARIALVMPRMLPTPAEKRAGAVDGAKAALAKMKA